MRPTLGYGCLTTLGPVGPPVAIGVVTPQERYQTYPFKWVQIDRLLRATTKIYWVLDPDFDETTPWTFSVWWSGSGHADWTLVETVQDIFFASDPVQREYGALIKGAYQVRLQTAEEGLYSSLPSLLPVSWTEKDLRIAEEIRRREERMYAANAGGTGFWILFRKTFGPKCPSCDNIAGEVEIASCPDCFGTGFTGGYWPPYSTRGLLAPTQRAIRQAVGTVYAEKTMLRYSPLPVVAEDDYVILEGLDARYRVEKAEVVAEIKGIPITQQITCSKMPPFDPIYNLQFGGVTGGAPSGATASDWLG